MVFSSMLFLWIFLPLVLAAYYISPGKIRNGILVFFSLLFYAWGEPLYVFLMLFSVAVNFTGGILIEKYQTRKKKILVATLIINLGLLGYFKYFGTLTEAITGLFSADGTGTTLFQVALPIGISFYTFQALSYVIDAKLMVPFSSVRISSFTTAMMLVLPKTLSLCSPADFTSPDPFHRFPDVVHII